jgi:hypothetical protein
MPVELPELRVVPIDALLFHEEADPSRVAVLQHRLAESGILRNPPIAAPLEEERFLVLDGVTRITALQRLDVPVVVVQIVPYPGSSVELRTWCHFIPQKSLANIRHLAETAGLLFAESSAEEARQGVEERRYLAAALDSRGHALTFSLAPEANPYGVLRAFVHGYSRTLPFERVAWEEVAAVLADRRADGVLLLFAPLTPEELREMVRRGEQLPAGITRHIVAGRLLHADIPLAELRRLGTSASSMAWLHQWWQERLRNHRLRYYPEPTFVFDD